MFSKKGKIYSIASCGGFHGIVSCFKEMICKKWLQQRWNQRIAFCGCKSNLQKWWPNLPTKILFTRVQELVICRLQWSDPRDCQCQYSLQFLPWFLANLLATGPDPEGRDEGILLIFTPRSSPHPTKNRSGGLLTGLSCIIFCLCCNAMLALCHNILPPTCGLIASPFAMQQ